MPGDRLVQRIEAGPLVAPVRPADPLIAELGDHAPAAPLACFGKRLALVFDGLIVCADAQIKGSGSLGHVTVHQTGVSQYAFDVISKGILHGICGGGLKGVCDAVKRADQTPERP